MRCRAYDWKSGNRFQAGVSPVQPGSLESESGIFALAFDKSGSRLASAEADKTVRDRYVFPARLACAGVSTR